MSIKIYGISQCNTVKKARQWLDENHIVAEFIDFKKQPPTQNDIEFWLTQIPKEVLINRRGTTWRKLSSEEQQAALVSDQRAIDLMLAQPSIIKRPVLIHNNKITIGFDPQRYTEIFGL